MFFFVLAYVQAFTLLYAPLVADLFSADFLRLLNTITLSLDSIYKAVIIL